MVGPFGGITAAILLRAIECIPTVSVSRWR